MLAPGERASLYYEVPGAQPDRPLELMCHLPGHVEAGMLGRVELGRAGVVDGVETPLLPQLDVQQGPEHVRQLERLDEHRVARSHRRVLSDHRTGAGRGTWARGPAVCTRGRSAAYRRNQVSERVFPWLSATGSASTILPVTVERPDGDNRFDERQAGDNARMLFVTLGAHERDLRRPS